MRQHTPLPDLQDSRTKMTLDRAFHDLTTDLEERNCRKRGFGFLGEHLAVDEIRLTLTAGSGTVSQDHNLMSGGRERLIPNRFKLTGRDEDVTLLKSGTWTVTRVTFIYSVPADTVVDVLLFRKD